MVLFIVLILVFSVELHARPEYAVRHGVVSCTACHASPTGGGIRNPYGKQYGTHGFKISKASDKAKWFQVDYRSEAFQSKNTATRKGLFTMTTIPSANIPIQAVDEDLPSMNFVMSYGLGRLDTALGNAYVLYNLKDDYGYDWKEHISVGRFNRPFGLMTDEHRNFTKLSVPSSTRDYETGVMLSGTPSLSFHYDIAATNGLQGDMPSVNDSPWALYANTRFIPHLGPMMIGASYAKHGTSSVEVRPEAINFYALFSVQKIKPSWPLVFIAEVQSARGWNNSSINSNMSHFFSSTFAPWQNSVRDTRSQTLMGEVDWYFNRHWIGLYRYEQYTPDSDFTGDRFVRHTYGLRWIMNAHSNLIARYERGYSTRPGVTEEGDVRTVGDTSFLMLHLWL